MEQAPETPTYTNRLIHETSPYLRQHAHNPVDWYPWGEEALARAKAENRPIHLRGSGRQASCLSASKVPLAPSPRRQFEMTRNAKWK